MIRDRDCPRCWGRMVPNMGPKCDPTEDGTVVIAEMLRCEVCGYELAVHAQTWADVEIAERVAAERSGDPEAYGYTPGKRWWPRAAS